MHNLEGIAQSTGRPLIALTIGDLLLEEEKIEARLLNWFELAEKWKAILLLDEADISATIYISQCGVEDALRSALPMELSVESSVHQEQVRDLLLYCNADKASNPASHCCYNKFKAYLYNDTSILASVSYCVIVQVTIIVCVYSSLQWGGCAPLFITIIQQRSIHLGKRYPNDLCRSLAMAKLDALN